MDLHSWIIENDIPCIANFIRSSKLPVVLDAYSINNIIKYNRIKILRMLINGKTIVITDFDEQCAINLMFYKDQHELLAIMLENKFFKFRCELNVHRFIIDIMNEFRDSTYDISHHTGMACIEKILLSCDYDNMFRLVKNYTIVIASSLVQKLLLNYRNRLARIVPILSKLYIIDEKNITNLYRKYPPGTSSLALKNIPHVSFAYHFHENYHGKYQGKYHVGLYEMSKCSIEMLMILHQVFKKYDSTLIDMHVFAFTIRDFLYYPI